ncbi:hypothetical protein A0256_08505 [Mucilaginibacter sp. PAMC 26640]|nr:hypothetical protein A0256_08505 [Mucilaginibacter sp. PAMC 26640]
MYIKLFVKIALTVSSAFLMLDAAAQPSDTARVVISQIKMPQLNRERTIRVFLPAGYGTANKKYPVIYMHDGQNIFTGNTSFAGSWLVDSTVKTFPVKQQAIIVGIDNDSQYRMAEYSPYDNKYARTQGDAYVEFIVKTLKPHIDSLYRTKTAARYTAIAGSSMGGLISMYAAVKYPKVFGVAGVFSPSFWIAPQMYPLVTNASNGTKQKFFFACGDMEGDNEVGDVLKMDSVLMAKGFNRMQVPNPLVVTGAKHNEKQWRGEFPVFYKWLIQ